MAKDTYIPRDEVVEMHKEFNKVREKVEKELMAIPGVLAVGVGLKETKGEIRRELCFKITVDKKKEKSKIKVKDRIPETIYGFKTDVVEKIISLPAANSKKYRPLISGCQIASSTKSGVGTLGCLAKRNSDNKIVLLTNWHVVIDNGTSIDGERIGQPNHNGCCSCCASGEFATVVGGQLNTTHDAAIALLHGQETDTIPEERYINEILGIGIIAGSAEPLGGETVYKYGRTTGLTKGQIINDNTSIGVDFSTTYEGFGTITRNGVQIDAVDPHPKFIDFGDSGSVSVNEHNQVVVLNWAIQGGGRITQVETDLGITILDSTFPNGTAGKEGVPLSSLEATDIELSLSDALSSLEIELHQFPEGKRLLDLFKVHRVELLDLVRNKREVMAAWHRYQGPAYLAHIARSVRRENKPIPDKIKGISLQNLLLKMTAVLQRNGSVELSKTVSENYLNIVQVLSHGKSPKDWKENLADLSKPINLHTT
jgi:hypothetical protein